MESWEYKLFKINTSVACTLPAVEVRRLGLRNGQRMLFWVGENKILASPMGSTEPLPKFEHWVRNIKIGPNNAVVVLPKALRDTFGLGVGDTIRMKFTVVNNYPTFMIRPKRQQVHVRMKHDGDKSTLEAKALTPDGKVDGTRDPLVKQVPYAEANSIAQKLEAGEDTALETEVKATRPVSMHYDPDYVPPKFLNRGEAQRIPEGEEDESYSQ